MHVYNTTFVHDHWKPYYQKNNIYVLCNAHHPRELQVPIEDKEVWAKKMKKLLLFMHKYRQFLVDGIPKEKYIGWKKYTIKLLKKV